MSVKIANMCSETKSDYSYFLNCVCVEKLILILAFLISKKLTGSRFISIKDIICFLETASFVQRNKLFTVLVEYLVSVYVYTSAFRWLDIFPITFYIFVINIEMFCM